MNMVCSLTQRKLTVIFGRSTLQPHPEWELNGTKLTETDNVTYLGVTLFNVKRFIGKKQV